MFEISFLFPKEVALSHVLIEVLMTASNSIENITTYNIDIYCDTMYWIKRYILI